MKIASRGDLLLAAPAFQRLRAERPQAHVTLLVGASCRDVAEHLPFFDRIHEIDDGALFGEALPRRTREAARMLAWIRASHFSEALVLHRDWRYGALLRLSGVPVRRGFATPRGARFLTHPYVAAEREHHIDQYLGIVGARGPQSALTPVLTGLWHFHPGERERALERAAAHGFAPRAAPWVGLGFGGGRNVKTRTTLKMWPVERYRALAAELDRRGYGVVWLGDRVDAELLGEPPVGVNLAGKLSVPGSAAVLGECAWAVANDTLLLHLAGAVGVPAVGIFGPTDPAHYHPRGPGSSHLWMGGGMPCSPCHADGYFPECAYDHRCMRELSVEAVLERVAGAEAQPLVKLRAAGN